MEKYDAVERLMQLATEKASPPGRAAGSDRDRVSVLRAGGRVREPLPHPAAGNEAGGVSPEPAVSTAERGRQLLGALRPFLPAAAGALRLVDHGAVQAVARLLPLLGKVGGGGSSAKAQPALAGSGTALAALGQGQSTLAGELEALRGRLNTGDEQLRRLRESLEKTVVEQGTLSHLLHEVADRSRFLTAAVTILSMLVVAEAVVVIILLRR